MRSISAFSPDSASGQDIRLDSRGNLAVVDELEDLRQRLIQKLRWELGEWFVATSRGVPYRNRIFSRSISVGLAASILTDQIRSERGVTNVLDVEAVINFQTRRMTYRARVVSDFGDFVLNEVL